MRAMTLFRSAFGDAHLSFSSIIEDHRYSEGRSVMSEQSDVHVELLVLCWLTLPRSVRTLFQKTFSLVSHECWKHVIALSMVSNDAHVFRRFDITQKKNNLRLTSIFVPCVLVL